MDKDTKEMLLDKAYEVRKNVLRMGYVDKRGFIAQGLDAADFLTVLFFYAMKYDPKNLTWEDRDRFILSNGHNSISVYAAMAEAGYFPKDVLDTYGKDDSMLPQSCLPKYTPGIEISAGSIGLGLPVGVGMAMGLKRKKSDSRVYIMMGDGELAEGPTWEAATSAGSYKLDNIIALIDRNGIQADGRCDTVVNTEPVDKKFEAFNFYVQRINGNSIEEVVNAVDNAKYHNGGRPSAIVCDTTPGQGVSFMIGNPKAHFISLNAEGWERAFAELERGKN